MVVTLGTSAGFCLASPSADPDGTNDNTLDGNKISMRFQAPADAVKITEIGWWCEADPESADYDVGLYDHDAVNDTPGLILVKADDITIDGPGWKKLTGLNIEVTGNTYYWVATSIPNTTEVTQGNYELEESNRYVAGLVGDLPADWDGENVDSNNVTLFSFYMVYETAAVGTNMQVNIGDSWKEVAAAKVNIGGAWKEVVAAQVNIGDAWKEVF